MNVPNERVFSLNTLSIRWEPVASFEGSEDIIETFWGRANAGGRDHHDIRAFKVGEEFMPVGPPRMLILICTLSFLDTNNFQGENENYSSPASRNPRRLKARKTRKKVPQSTPVLRMKSGNEARLPPVTQTIDPTSDREKTY